MNSLSVESELMLMMLATCNSSRDVLELRNGKLRFAETETFEDKVEIIAQFCHQVNTVFCLINGDHSHASWESSPEHTRESSRAGVRVRLQDPLITAESLHEKWREYKVNDGWVYGPIKDPVKKTHPCMVNYDSLSEVDKKKDKLFLLVVNSFIV